MKTKPSQSKAKPLLKLALKAPDKAVTAALTLALAIVGKEESPFFTNTIQWAVSPGFLVISAFDSGGRVLHTVRIPAEQQPGRKESFQFCMKVADAKAMTTRVSGGGEMEIRIEQTVLAASYPNTHADAEYYAEARWVGTKRQGLSHIFTGVSHRFPCVDAVIPVAGSATASITGSAEELLEFLSPSTARLFHLEKGTATQALSSGSVGSNLQFKGNLKETFNVEFPVQFLKQLPRDRVVTMEFTGQGNIVKMYGGLHGAIATCLFMPLSMND